MDKSNIGVAMCNRHKWLWMSNEKVSGLFFFREDGLLGRYHGSMLSSANSVAYGSVVVTSKQRWMSAWRR